MKVKRWYREKRGREGRSKSTGLHFFDPGTVPDRKTSNTVPGMYFFPMSSGLGCNPERIPSVCIISTSIPFLAVLVVALVIIAHLSNLYREVLQQLKLVILMSIVFIVTGPENVPMSG